MTVLTQLDVTRRVLKRAQYEAFAFELDGGAVVVRNESHADPADHEYRVELSEGVPATCECPADANYEGACKHRVAVAIRAPVLEAARAQDGPAERTSEGREAISGGGRTGSGVQAD